MIIQISKHLGTTTPSEFSKQYPVKVETQEGETTEEEVGSKLSMTRYPAKRNPESDSD